MARAIFSHELTDPDFEWLLNMYCEAHPTAVRLETSCLPVVIILCEESGSISHQLLAAPQLLALPSGDYEDDSDSSQDKN